LLCGSKDGEQAGNDDSQTGERTVGAHAVS
jgi:hypothetical protein